ncbi:MULTISPECIES: hypothetical protein [unclassified Streptomyces]|uniref:hypothetical protein n=1 Tax=unclassified Streptomyces TaxID=2593676 RepID=UPI003633A4E2
MMQQHTQGQNPPPKSAPRTTATAATVDAAAVTALQNRVAQLTDSGVLTSAPYSYHH